MKFLLTATALLAGTASAFSPAVYSPRAATSLKMSTKLSQDELKKLVGYKAVDDYVKSGTVIGLGKKSGLCGLGFFGITTHFLKALLTSWSLFANPRTLSQILRVCPQCRNWFYCLLCGGESRRKAQVW